jgi:hypothetical protein
MRNGEHRGALGKICVALATSTVLACGQDHSALFDSSTADGAGGQGTTATNATSGATGATGGASTTGGNSGGGNGSITTGPTSTTGAGGAPGTGGSGGRDDAGVSKDAGAVHPHPFGSHSFRYTAGSILPTGDPKDLDRATSDFYDAWKARYLVAACGGYYVFTRADPPGRAADPTEITTSEAHGYGMTIAAIMDGYDPSAQAIFDGMYAFFRKHPSVHSPDLMAWEQLEGCASVDRPDNTPDSEAGGDLDIAFALLLADRQWGSRGAIDYLGEARKVLAAIQSGDMNGTSHLTILGDWAKSPDNAFHDATRPSELRPDHFRAFGSAAGDSAWRQSVEATYGLVAKMQSMFASSTGLLPDFVATAGTAPAPAGSGFLSGPTDGEYGYSACLFPWRLGADFLVTGEPRAKTALAKLDTWIRGATMEDETAIVDGYQLGGARSASARGASWAFTGPFAVAATIGAEHQAWLDSLWDEMVKNHPDPDSSNGYFGNTIKLLTMIVLSGNWWQP